MAVVGGGVELLLEFRGRVPASDSRPCNTYRGELSACDLVAGASWSHRRAMLQNTRSTSIL